MMIDDDPSSTPSAAPAAKPEPGASGHDDAGLAPDPAPGPQSAAGAAGTDEASPLSSSDDAASSAPRRKRPRRRSRRGADRPVAGEAEESAAAEGELTPPDSEMDAVSADPVIEPIDADALFAEVVSGAYDESVESAPVEAPPARRILAPEPDAPKLHKVLAQSGIGSRRDLEQMIAEGRVSVNGQPSHTGQRVSWGDRVTIDGKPVKIQITAPPPRVLAYHKPVGEIVSLDDPQQRPTVFRRLPRLPRGKWQSVGRLDLNTEGLLLFTNSGDLANRLMHPRFAVEREYAVRILGALSDEGRQRLLEGIDIEGQMAALLSIEDGGGEGANRWYRVVIAEGRNREVRRLFEAVGHAVSRLIRIRYGSVVLPRGLRRGACVDLSPQDVKTLREVSGAVRAAVPGDEGDTRGPRSSRRGRKTRRPEAAPPGRALVDAPAATRDEDFEEPSGPIPNPLQQTYDRRAVQRPRGQRRVEDEGGPIPNPLVQTYDRRAAEMERRIRPDLDDEAGPIPNPLQQTYDRRFVQKGRGGGGAVGGGGGAPGAPGQRKRPGGPRKDGKAVKGAAAGAQPDPMRTSVGYIGADAFLKPAKGARPARASKGGRRR